MRSETFRDQLLGRGANITQKKIKSIKVPILDKEILERIFTLIELEQETVNGNKKLIESYEQKIKDKIAEVWGE